jgi:ABC-type polysaccharide/polyol phosphate export permease
MTGQALSEESVASLTVKAIPWAFFSGALTVATSSILSHAGLIGKVFFVRESLPIAAVLAQVVDSTLAVCAAVLVLVFIGLNLTVTALWALPVAIMLVAFTVGCSLILSCSNLFFRDVKYITQVALSFGVFATPVFFEPSMLGGTGSRVMLMMPLSPFIQALDVAVVRGHSLLERVEVATSSGVALIWDPWLLAYALFVSLATIWVGLVVFRRASVRFAEVS